MRREFPVSIVATGETHERHRYANGEYDPGVTNWWFFRLNVPKWYLCDSHIQAIMDLFGIYEHGCSGPGTSFANVDWQISNGHLLITRTLSFDV